MNLLLRVLLLLVLAGAAILILFEFGSELVILRSRVFITFVVVPLVILFIYSVRKAAEEIRNNKNR